MEQGGFVGKGTTLRLENQTHLCPQRPAEELGWEGPCSTEMVRKYGLHLPARMGPWLKLLEFEPIRRMRKSTCQRNSGFYSHGL